MQEFSGIRITHELHLCSLPSFCRQQRQFSSIQAVKGRKERAADDVRHEDEADFFPRFTLRIRWS